MAQQELTYLMDKTHLSRTLGPSAGIAWYKSAVRATARQPFALASITFCYLFAMGLLSAVPFFGFVFSAVFMPFGSVWIARSAPRSRAVRPATAVLQSSFATKG